MQNQERLDRMRRAMERERLDAMVVRLPENVLLLSGFWPMIGASFLLFPREGRSLCVIPHCYEQESAGCLWEAEAVYHRYGVLDAPEPGNAVCSILSRAARGKGWKRIGYEAGFETIAPPWNSGESQVPASCTLAMYRSAFEGAEIVDASALLQAERRIKTPYEIDRIRTASEISCIGLEAFEQMVAPGTSGVELVAAVEREIMVRGTGHKGATRVRAYAQVAAGPEESAVGYRPNEISTQRRLERGDVALLELGVVADGFWADRTRVRVAGDPSDQQEKAFEAVRQAQEAAVAAIRPGVSGAEVDEAARSVIRDAGFGDFFPHITGHGLGLG
jgi:Xaa-Pro aminopeptidase